MASQAVEHIQRPQLQCVLEVWSRRGGLGRLKESTTEVAAAELAQYISAFILGWTEVAPLQYAITQLWHTAVVFLKNRGPGLDQPCQRWVHATRLACTQHACMHRMASMTFAHHICIQHYLIWVNRDHPDCHFCPQFLRKNNDDLWWGRT